MVDPCKVCGGTDLNLVDGFYYCVECGTQDQTARETVVERVDMGDGTFAIGTRKKISKKKSKLQVSGEWYKWHAYNFILCGLTDELIALGAKPSLKAVVLWIWTRYIKKYHIKEEYRMNNAPKKNQLLNNNVDEDNNNGSDHSDCEDLTADVPISSSVKDIRTMTYTNIYGILYIALNLDRSDIQMSHFLRYIREGRLTFQDSLKYIPSDFDKKKIPQWMSFLNSRTNPFSSAGMLRVAAALFKRLDLGTPIIPDLKALVTIYVKELCLPKDFLSLVLSLFEFMPVEIAMNRFFKLNTQFPDFESVAMSYVLVALKMCFGLDDDYELKVSDVVDKVNEEENNLKSYRVGITEQSERLFSFREWITYLEFRKIVLCQYYQPMASRHNFDEDSLIVSELLKDGMIEAQIKKVNIELEHELLKRIPLQGYCDIFAKEEFPASRSPLTAYTQFLISKIQDPQTRFLLSEDFSKYSLKYALEDMLLKDDDGKNVIEGVNTNNKTISDKILGTMRYQGAKCNTEIIFIKDTDNEDWIKDFESDNLQEISDKENIGADESIEDVFSVSKDITKEGLKKEEPNKCEKLEELDFGEKNIFFDDFDEIEYHENLDSADEIRHQPEYVFEFNDTQLETFSGNEINDSGLIPREFDPTTFDREDVIKKIILTVCRKHKIPVPIQYKEPAEARKRPMEATGESKRRRTAAGSTATQVSNILDKYHALLRCNNSQQSVSMTDLNESDIERENGSDPNTAIENPDELRSLGEETYNQDSIGCQESEVENRSVHDNGASNNDSNVDINELLEEYDDLADCLQNDKICDILNRELPDVETDRSGRLKSLKETLHKRDIVLKQKCNRKNMSTILAPLIPNSDNVQEFNYYIRHYVKRLLGTHLRRSYSFEAELTANCPKSFKYLLQLCASIIEVPAWNLFRVFQALEVCMVKTNSKTQHRRPPAR